MRRVCPFWIGYLLVSPLRKLVHNPIRILSPLIRPGMTVLDIGSAMGYFSIPMAELVGREGKVFSVDLQERMIKVLKKRAARHGVADRIEARVSSEKSLEIGDLAGRVDFALAFAVVHEVPDPAGLFSQVYAALKPGGTMLLSEPKGHVSAEDFRDETETAECSGFKAIGVPRIIRSRSLLLQKYPSGK